MFSFFRRNVAAKAPPPSAAPPDGLPLDERVDWWDRFSTDETSYILAIYRKGKDTVVDVLFVAGVDDDGKRVFLYLEAPKPDKWTVLAWEREFKLREDRLVWWQPLDREFDRSSRLLDRYEREVLRGMGIAKQLARAEQQARDA